MSNTTNTTGGDNKSNIDREVSQRFLPNDFVPGCTDVIIGRGKKCANHDGNKNLRSIVASRLEQYSMAVTKREKSQVLAAVVVQIRTGNPNGKFIKQDADTQLWFDVGNVLAREKISQAFRDALVHLYRSSNDFKKKRRRAMKKEEDLMLALNHARPEQVNSMNVPVNDSIFGFKPLSTPTFSSISNPLSVSNDLFKIVPLEPTSISQMVSDKRMSSNAQKVNHFERRNYSGKTTGLDELEEIDTSGLVSFNMDLIW